MRTDGAEQPDAGGRPHGASHVAPPAEDPLDRTRFPAQEWHLTETRFDGSDLGRTETLFAVGNGYLGMRGNYEESRDFSANGTYINGFHETWPIQHAEDAYGFAKVGQTIVNAPDAKIMRLYVDDVPLELSTADIAEYERSLDMREGVLRRRILWRTPAGKRVLVESSRMVSFTQRHLAVLTLRVTMLDDDAPIVISSQLLNRQDADRGAAVELARQLEELDPRRSERFEHRVLEPEGEPEELPHGRISLRYKCAHSQMTMAVAVDHTLTTENASIHEDELNGDMAKRIFRIDAAAGTPIEVVKTVSYHTADVVPSRELLDRCARTLDRVAVEGIEKQTADQRAWLQDFWDRCDIEVPGQPAVQQAVRWNLFALAQAASRADGLGIPAKGVSGSGYSGHYFWDTEIYVMPFLTYTSPQAARNALRFRHRLLHSARERAAEMAQRGALFPWRTINGQEASAYYAAGTAQYHIDADVSYALSQYVGATGDFEFLDEQAVDILVETARMWADLGFWSTPHEPSGTAEVHRAFHIHGVTGPDEYTTVVDDNLFTNVMARFNLRRAAEAVRFLRERRPEAYERMLARVGLEDDESAEWDRCAAAMTIPFDERLGIHPQDAHFLTRELWDLRTTPESKRPLLLHFHPLVIYRYQVLKQADVVLALFLQGAEFSRAQKKADFDYYDAITTGDSTLSAVVQSIVAAEVGYPDLALRYFYAALFVDLADRHGNTADGVHVASTGGTWNAMVCGFGGFRDHGAGRWTFDPRLPAGWESLTFRLTLRGTRVRVTVRSHAIVFDVEDGEQPVTVCVRGEDVEIEPGRTVEVALSPETEGLPCT